MDQEPIGPRRFSRPKTLTPATRAMIAFQSTRKAGSASRGARRGTAAPGRSARSPGGTARSHRPSRIVCRTRDRSSAIRDRGRGWSADQLRRPAITRPGAAIVGAAVSPTPPATGAAIDVRDRSALAGAGPPTSPRSATGAAGPAASRGPRRPQVNAISEADEDGRPPGPGPRSARSDGLRVPDVERREAARPPSSTIASTAASRALERIAEQNSPHASAWKITMPQRRAWRRAPARASPTGGPWSPDPHRSRPRPGGSTASADRRDDGEGDLARPDDPPRRREQVEQPERAGLALAGERRRARPRRHTGTPSPSPAGRGQLLRSGGPAKCVHQELRHARGQHQEGPDRPELPRVLPPQSHIHGPFAPWSSTAA